MIDLDHILNYTVPRPDSWTLFGNGEQFDALPAETKDQVLFLNREASDYLLDLLHVSRLVTGGGWDPFTKGNFKTVETFDQFNSSDESRQLLKKWLYRRGLPFSGQVFLLTNVDCAIITTLKMVIRYSADIFPFDDTVIFDRTLNWCLFFYHENLMSFGRDKMHDASEDEKMMAALNERKKKFPQFRHPYL